MTNKKMFLLTALLLLVATPLMAADFNMVDGLSKFFGEMGFASFFAGEGWKNAVMLAIGCVLLYLAIKKEYEPLLLLPIAFGMILTNLPGAGLFHTDLWNADFLNPESEYYHSYGHIMAEGGLLDILYIGVKAGIYPCLHHRQTACIYLQYCPSLHYTGRYQSLCSWHNQDLISCGRYRQ